MKSELSIGLFQASTLALAVLMLAACGGSSSSPTSSTPPAAQPPPDEFEIRVDLTNEALHPILNAAPDSSLDDLEPLARVAMARVVGMGEATHGTQEFFHLKHKIFRWLVETRGVRVFAMESDVSEGIYIDRYVQSGEGDLEAIMLQRMHYWPWYTEEVRDLIEWMTDYNAANPDAEPLRYIGVDSATVGMQPDLITEMVASAAPGLLDDTEMAVTPLNVSMLGAWDLYAAMTQDEYDTIRSGLEALRVTLVAHEDDLVSGSSATDYQMLLYLLDNLIDSHRAMFDVYNEPDHRVRFEFRDNRLAANVLRIEDLVGPGTRIAIWAHNGHVASYPLWENTPTMGTFLRQALGSDYRVIGFSFSHGDFMAQRPGVGLQQHSIDLPPLSGSLGELLHAADSADFILDTGALTASALLTWLSQTRPMLVVGAVFDPELSIEDYYTATPLLQAYDTIIHIDQSTAAVPLPIP